MTEIQLLFYSYLKTKVRRQFGHNFRRKIERTDLSVMWLVGRIRRNPPNFLISYLKSDVRMLITVKNLPSFPLYREFPTRERVRRVGLTPTRNSMWQFIGCPYFLFYLACINGQLSNKPLCYSYLICYFMLFICINPPLVRYYPYLFNFLLF